MNKLVCDKFFGQSANCGAELPKRLAETLTPMGRDENPRLIGIEVPQRARVPIKGRFLDRVQRVHDRVASDMNLRLGKPSARRFRLEYAVGANRRSNTGPRSGD